MLLCVTAVLLCVIAGLKNVTSFHSMPPSLLRSYVPHTQAHTAAEKVPSLFASSSKVHASSAPETFGGDDKDGEKMASMVKMIVEAVDEGREGDLQDAGLKVTKRSTKDIIDSNIENEQIRNKVLGPMTDNDSVEIMKELQSVQQDIASGSVIPRGGGDVPKELMEELKSEAFSVLRSQTGSAVAQELGAEGGLELGINTGEHEHEHEHEEEGRRRGKCAPGTETLLRPIAALEDADDKNGGGGTLLPETRRVTSSYEMDLVAEIEAENTRIEQLNKDASDAAEEEEELEAAAEAAAAAAAAAKAQLEAVSRPLDAMIPARIVAMAAAEETEENANFTPELQQSAQDIFGQLLHATMEEATAAAAAAVDGDSDVNLDANIKKATIDAVANNDMDALDVRRLLGDTMAMLTDVLDLDMNSEFADAKTRGDMQAIVAGGMSELASNMKELDEKSDELFIKLGNLEQELHAETAAFNEKKSGELEKLLDQQSALQADVQASRVKVEASAAQLENLMADLEEKADVITALALFPVKSIDKKAAFVVGLGALFKSMYNTSELFAVRSLDLSEWLDVVVQLGLVFVFFSHYGLVKALGNPRQDLGIPPPPP